MGLFKFLTGGGGQSSAPAKTHTLIAIEWDRIQKNVEDLSFLGEFQNPVIWVFARSKGDQSRISKLLNNRPFTIKEQPSYERKLGIYFINAVLYEVLTNPRYKKVVVVAGDDFMDSTVTFWKANGIDADLRIFEPGGPRRGNGSERQPRADQRRDDQRREDPRREAKRPEQADRRRERPERAERQPRAERPEQRQEQRPERQPRPQPEGRQPQQPQQQPNYKERLQNPEPIAAAIAGAIARNFEIGQNYTISRMAQVVKDSADMPITIVFGYRGNRIMLDRMVEQNIAQSEDERNFSLSTYPSKEFILDLIVNRKDGQQEKRGGKFGRRDRKGRRPDEDGDGYHEEQEFVAAQ